MRRILDDKYEKADLNEVMTKQYHQHLTATERHKLLQSLKKIEDMFNGMLGMWNTTPVYLELKDDAKPVCSRPYPVPKVQKMMFKKEVKIIVRLGVHKEENYSK